MSVSVNGTAAGHAADRLQLHLLQQVKGSDVRLEVSPYCLQQAPVQLQHSKARRFHFVTSRLIYAGTLWRLGWQPAFA